MVVEEREDDLYRRLAQALLCGRMPESARQRAR